MSITEIVRRRTAPVVAPRAAVLPQSWSPGVLSAQDAPAVWLSPSPWSDRFLTADDVRANR